MSLTKDPQIRVIASSLLNTGWARGAFNGRRYTRPARKAQIMAGARKIVDQINSGQRKAQKAA